MYRLFEIGIDLKLLKLIKDFYSDAECCVKIGVTVVYNQSRCTRGASTIIDVISSVHESCCQRDKVYENRCRISNIHLPCPTLADHLSQIALSIYAMQQMLNTALCFSKRWRFEFRAPKRYLLMYSDIDTETNVYLAGKAIPQVKTAKHLGTLLVTNGANDIDLTEGRIARSRSCICGFMSIGCRTTPINCLPGNRVYSSMSLSRMMYGLDVSDISTNSIKCLENTHWEMAKGNKGLNQSTSNPFVLPAIGWCSIESLIGKARN